MRQVLQLFTNYQKLQLDEEISKSDKPFQVSVEQLHCLFTINAVRNATSPVFLFPRVYLKDVILKGASTRIANHTGQISSDAFHIYWMILSTLQTTQRKKLMLIVLDSHESHITIEVINKTKENEVCILTFPPHCSHKRQQFDISVFSTFKC